MSQVTAFQVDAFQNDAFQIASVPAVVGVPQGLIAPWARHERMQFVRTANGPLYPDRPDYYTIRRRKKRRKLSDAAILLLLDAA